MKIAQATWGKCIAPNASSLRWTPCLLNGTSLFVPFCHHPYLEMPFSLSKFLITFIIFPVAMTLQIYPCAKHSNEQLPFFNLYEICIFFAVKGRHGQEIAVGIYCGEKWPMVKKLSMPNSPFLILLYWDENSSLPYTDKESKCEGQMPWEWMGPTAE